MVRLRRVHAGENHAAGRTGEESRLRRDPGPLRGRHHHRAHTSDLQAIYSPTPLASDEDEEDFDIIAIVVDDFECHGYEEFKGGLESYAERNDLDLTPGQVAEKYGIKSLPRLVVIDAKSKVHYIHDGYEPGDENTLKEVLDHLTDAKK